MVWIVILIAVIIQAFVDVLFLCALRSHVKSIESVLEYSKMCAKKANENADMLSGLLSIDEHQR